MIASLDDLLADARRRGTAVGAFTCYDAESAAGVLGAAAGTRPVVILVSAELLRSREGELVAAGLLGMAERARSPVCVQLDHSHDLETIAVACGLGFGAVMADGSHLPYDRNVAFVLAARDLALRHGAQVEAEIGHIAGEEERAAPAVAGPLTDPDQAVSFARDTGADCVAVSVGTVHGLSRGDPQLDLERLAEIRSRVPVPLALHGGSGLAPGQVAAAVAAGAAKVNFNTELRQAYLGCTERELSRSVHGARLLHLHRRQVRAVRSAASEKLAALGGERTLAEVAGA